MPKPKNLFKNAGINVVQYGKLQRAFDLFNEKLFENKLPSTIITIRGKNCVNGFYRKDSFTNRIKKENKNIMSIDEIALNPDHFDRTSIEILSTLVHEMCHQAQCRVYNEKPKSYHDKTWANIMITIGLMPSNTGEPGGKRTGSNMTHYILADGLFKRTYDKFKSKLKLNLKRIPDPPKVKKAKKKANKVKYNCQKCNCNVWGKPGLLIACLCDKDNEGLTIFKEKIREEK